MYIQADNAAGQNKNQFILFCLVFFQQFFNLDLIVYNFMVSGRHTHFTPDRHFGMVHAKKAAKGKIETVEDLLSCDSNIREEKNIFKIKDFLNNKSKEFQDISKYYSFVICNGSNIIKAFDFMQGDVIDSVEKFRTSEANKEYEIGYIRNLFEETKAFFESNNNYAEFRKYSMKEATELISSLEMVSFLSETVKTMWKTHIKLNSEESRSMLPEKKKSKKAMNEEENIDVDKFEYVSKNMEIIFNKLLQENKKYYNMVKKKSSTEESIDMIENVICELGTEIKTDCLNFEVDDEVVEEASQNII